MATETIVDNWLLNFLHDSPILSIISYIALNVIIYGFKGLLGGYFPTKITLSVGSFYTSRQNAYRSERLTRIVQWRFFNGSKLPQNVREEILEKYGPSKFGGRLKGHYKDIVINKEYKFAEKK